MISVDVATIRKNLIVRKRSVSATVKYYLTVRQISESKITDDMAVVKYFFTTQSGRDILENPGTVSQAIAKSFAESEFEKYRIVQDRLFESDFDKMAKRLAVGREDIEALETMEIERVGQLKKDVKSPIRKRRQPSK